MKKDWIKAICEFCNRNEISYEQNVLVDNKKIDFKIENYFIAVEDNIDNEYLEERFSFYKEKHIIVATKTENATEVFGKPNGYKSNGLRYLKKCPTPLIGIDVDLFIEPEFPYSPDRPKCFYEVRVGKDRSSHEAFFDEKFRWEMIKNRIEYSGGYIDGKQILMAMNVTRKCKQPSWYSVAFAKRVMEEYCTSNTIVDPFAGWGARSDAAQALHKCYIACDLNEELVEWHQSKGRNIVYCDANEFKYDGDCSVFICPPYQDVETYFEGQDLATTQCEWLLVTMQNVPNAREYVLTCKVIDPSFEKFVKGDKINKSHFGTNKEHIVVVTNEEAKELLKEYEKK